MCAASTSSSAPTSSAIARNASKSMTRGYAVAPAMIMPRPLAHREVADHVVVEHLGVVVDAVRDEVVHAAAEVDRRAVREVAALVEAHAHHLVARLEQRHERGLVRVGARVRLHVRVLGAEQRARPVAREVLGLVDDEVAAVVALGRVALGVLVGEHRALRLEHRGRREVLRRDQLDRGVLALELAPDDVGDLGIGALQRRDVIDSVLLVSRSAAISSMRRSWRPPSNGVSRKMRVISSASSAATIRAPIDSTLALLCCAGHAGGVEVVAERGADAVHLVGRDLLALAAAAEHDAASRRRRAHRARDRRADRRVVDRSSECVPRSSTSWPHVLQHPDQVLLERVAGVVAADRDAHAASVPTGPAPGSGSAPARVVAGGQYRRRRGRRSRAPADHARASCAGPTRCAGAASRASTRRQAEREQDRRHAVRGVEPRRGRRPARAGGARAAAPGGVRRPAELEPEQQALYRAASARLPRRVRRSRRARRRPRLAHAPPRARRRAHRRRRASRPSSPTAAASCASSCSAAAPRRAAPRRRRGAHRARAHRGVGAGAARHRRGRRDRAASSSATPPTSSRRAPKRTRGSANGSSCVLELAADGAPAPAPTARAARSSPAATQFPADAAMRMKKRLLSDIVSLTPSNYDDFAQCPRLFTATGPARPARERSGRRDRDRACSCTTCCAKIHDRRLVRRHRRTSPTCSRATASTRPRARARRAPRRAAARRPNRRRRARGRRSPASTGSRRRCSWRPRASTRSGCTTACSTRATTRPARAARRAASPTIPPRKVQAFVLARRAPRARPAAAAALRVPAARGRRRPRAVGARRRRPRRDRGRAARRGRAHVDATTTGAASPTSSCAARAAYRSICRDSAAPGEPAWPVLVTERRSRRR